MNEKNNTNGKIGNDLGMYKAYMLNAIETVGWILNSRTLMAKIRLKSVARVLYQCEFLSLTNLP